jgi:asparagine synthase (glutamine-hydrolysing)
MCGLVGYFSKSNEVSREVCQEMADTLVHRGPDDSGVWLDRHAGIVLGHRRLSIQDLSKLGHQPMESSSGRYVLSYNGEIYNFKLLQKELEQVGCRFKGCSDTETLLAAVEYWGIDKALKRFFGMFAFALWDKEKSELTLARDRIGEKPLYYGWQGQSLLFGSELKALRSHPYWRGGVDRDALTLLMRHNYIPAPYSIYRGIKKLLPGTYVQFNPEIPVGEMPDPSAYWSMKEIAEQGASNLFQYDDQEAFSALDQLLTKTIQDKMISDVPLGAFLSGGIDSSLVVALMQATSSQKVKTFSIGFHEADYNEAEHAKAVAAYLGTEHTELYVTPDEAMQVIPKLSQLYDEPFADSSQIPTFLLSKMTKQYVTVALSGDAGDELFAGYNRYFLQQSLWNKLSKIPQGMRTMMASILLSIPVRKWNIIGPVLGRLTSHLQQRPGDKIHKLAEVLSVSSEAEFYRVLVSLWKQPEKLVLGGHEPITVLSDPAGSPNMKSFVQTMQYLDSISYLPDDILCKVDRAAMAVSLETRVPFLDHRIVEFAWRLPMHQKIRNGQGKWLLRQVLHKYVPRHLIERPKMGFGIPIDAWLRGPLKDWAEALIDEKRLREEGFFDPEPIRRKWDQHISGHNNWAYHLWGVLMFQLWLEDTKTP